eukprot:m51a1_g6195 hypothetical protein (343) ;mRNA; f:92335-93933
MAETKEPEKHDSKVHAIWVTHDGGNEMDVGGVEEGWNGAQLARHIREQRTLSLQQYAAADLFLDLPGGAAPELAVYLKAGTRALCAKKKLDEEFFRYLGDETIEVRVRPGAVPLPTQPPVLLLELKLYRAAVLTALKDDAFKGKSPALWASPSPLLPPSPEPPAAGGSSPLLEIKRGDTVREAAKTHYSDAVVPRDGYLRCMVTGIELPEQGNFNVSHIWDVSAQLRDIRYVKEADRVALCKSPRNVLVVLRSVEQLLTTGQLVITWDRERNVLVTRILDDAVLALSVLDLKLMQYKAGTDFPKTEMTFANVNRTPVQTGHYVPCRRLLMQRSSAHWSRMKD